MRRLILKGVTVILYPIALVCGTVAHDILKKDHLWPIYNANYRPKWYRRIREGKESKRSNEF